MLVCMCWDTDRAMEEDGLSRGMTGTASAGRLAAEAGVGTLILTHIGPHLDQPEVREEGIKDAQAAFGGRVVFGEELMVLEVGRT
jgi:ribonuclease BN (tRNA processing enzyme)